MEDIGEIHNRIKDDKYVKYLTVFEAVENLMKKETPAIIAIDGRCGSGKSFLAKSLAEVFDCNVFHMDDYFLPFEMKTQERLAQPGGNVHYERFDAEILSSLQKKEVVIYRPYQCATGTLAEPIYVRPKKLSIVEGSYCLHPMLQHAYDLRILLTLDAKVQKQRILERNGEEKLKIFISQWIPLENYYFSTLHLEAKSDIILDTSCFWK